MNPVVHFEMPYEDQKRMADFYTKAFGRKAQLLGPEMGNYVVVDTVETPDNTTRSQVPGAINGGLFKKSAENSSPSVVISVVDIREAMKRVEEAGDKVIGGQKPGEPDNIPGVGLYAAIIDTEGNRVSLLQPNAVMERHPGDNENRPDNVA